MQPPLPGMVMAPSLLLMIARMSEQSPFKKSSIIFKVDSEDIACKQY